MNIEMTRRNLLKSIGLGAGALALDPFLGQLAASEAKAAKPLRVVFVIQSNGFMFQHAVPSGIMRPANDAKSYDKPIDVSLKDREFHPALEPLAAFKDRICLVQNLSNRIAYSDHSCCFGVLGCSPKNEAWGPSADILCAEALPAAFKHVGLGYSDTHSDTYTISASAKGKPVPILHSPLEAYKSLFGSATDAGVKTFDTRTNILEFMTGDVKRSQAALPADQKPKLDSYAEAYATLRERQGKLLALRGSIKQHAPKLDEAAFAQKPNSSTLLKAHFDIAAAVLIAGMTNVVTLISAAGGPQGQWPELGLPDLHGLGHGGKWNYESHQAAFTALRQHHTKLIAELAAKLQATPEGTGTMLDNTLIVYQSDSTDGHHPSCYNNPMVLIGNLGGKLKTEGRYLDFPGYTAKGHRTMATFYNTLFQAVGAPSEKFGIDDVKVPIANQRGVISELLA